MKNLFACMAVTMMVIGTTTAQTIDKDTINLNGVGVTASRFSMETATSDIIKPDSSFSYSQETPSYFSKAVSVVSQSDNGTPFGYSYFTLRGMGQTRVNYTLNGVPLNDGEDLATYTSNYTDLVGNLRSIQIIRGAGVSSNGASSYAGLINMDMKSPFDVKSTQFSAMYGSFNSHKENLSYNSGIIGKHFGVYASVSNTGTDGFREYSFGKSNSAYLSTGYISERLSVRFNTVYGTTKNGQSWLPVPEGSDASSNPLVFGTLSPQSDDFKQGIYQVQSSYAISDKSILTFSPYIDTINGGYDFPLDESTLGNLNLDSRNQGAYASWKRTDDKISTEVGGNYNDFKRKHDSEIYGDHYVNTGYKLDCSAYFKGLYKSKSFTFNGNIQYRKAKFSYEGSELSQTFFDYGFTNLFAGISYDKSKFKPHVSFSKTTREPTRTDLFGYNDNIDMSNLSQVNSVKPETVNDIEAGFGQEGRLSYQANVYYMEFSNEILSTNQLNYLGILLRKNVDRSRRVGLEVEASYDIKKDWRIGGNASVSQNCVLIDGSYKEPILTPRVTSYVYSSLKHKKFTFEANYKYVSESYLESSNNNSFKVADYHLVNIVVGYEATKKLSVSAFANNLLNKNWQTSGNAGFDMNGNPVSRNYFYSCGSNFYIQAIYKFK